MDGWLYKTAFIILFNLSLLLCTSPAAANTTTRTATTTTTRTSTTSTTTSAPPYNCEITTTTSSLATALNKTFQTLKNPDVFFIIGNTPQENKDEFFDNVKKIISGFVAYGSHHKFLVDQGYSQLSVLDLNTSKDDLKFMDVPVCSIKEYVDDILNKGTQGQSVMDVNLAVIEAMDLRRNKEEKVIFVLVVSDKETCLDAVYRVLESRRKYLEVFVIGYDSTNGRGLGSADSENQLKRLASDADHYACINSWEMLKEKPPKEGAIYKQYVHPKDSICSASEVWACDLLSQKYSCVCDINFYSAPDKSCTSCDNGKCKATIGFTSCTDDCDKPYVYQGDSSLFWIIFGVTLAIFFFLALLVLIIFLGVSVLRFKKRQSSRRDYQAPPVPPSVKISTPLIRERSPNSHPRPTSEDNQDDDDFTEFDEYEKTGSPPPLASPTNLDPPIYENKAFQSEDYMNISRPSYRGSVMIGTIIQAVQPSAKLYEYDMPGWKTDLEKQVNESDIEAIAVYHLDGQHWARTKGIRLRTQTLQEFDRVMKAHGSGGSQDPDLFEVSIGDSKFRVDRNAVTETELCMTGPVLNDDMYQPHATVIWACRAEQYMVVAKAKRENSEECRKQAKQLQQHLLPNAIN